MPSWASCSIAAGRRVSSDAISTFLPSLLVSQRPILAVLVVLPEPCSPTIRIGTGATARRLISSPSPSVSTSVSWTILMTCWPGLTERMTSWPTARSRTLSTNSLTTGSATSASSSATRTSRSASFTSLSLSAPRLVRRSKMPPRRSVRLSNMAFSGVLGSRSIPDHPNHERARARNSRTDGPPRERITKPKRSGKSSGMYGGVGWLSRRGEPGHAYPDTLQTRDFPGPLKIS
jgi:hypothetical protein